jgi:hypothetical protein
MKTFKEYVKSKKYIVKKVNDIPSISEPIHFKHVKGKNRKKKKPLKEDVPKIHDWIKKNDNHELGKTSDEISDKIKKNGFNNVQQEAINAYTIKSEDLNKHLINPNPNERGYKREYYEHHAEILDSAIDSNRIDHKIHVYSGVSFDPEKLKNKDGLIRSPAFISATHDKAMAHGFAKESDITPTQHILHFHLEPGDPAAHIAHHSNFQGRDSEHETIIKRGAVLKYHSSQYIPSSVDMPVAVRIHHVSIHKE